MQVASFYVDDELYGVPVYLIEEFFRPLPITTTPRVDQRIEGLVNFRGSTIIVLSLRSCFGKPPLTDTNTGKMILLVQDEEIPAEGRRLGLRSFEEPVVLHVDRVHRIFNIATSEVEDTPAHLADRFLSGLVRFDEKYLMLLDIHALIQDIHNKGQVHDDE